jgi:hypothetical protein
MRHPLYLSVKLVAVAAFVMASQVWAQTPPAVSGTFSSKGVSFKIAGGIAFNGQSSLDPDTPMIVVALSNVSLNVEGLSDFVDRKRAIEKLVKDDETGIVYLEFTPQGRWHGLSYYFGSGNGCGFCTSEVTSSVKLTAGKLVGTLKGTEKDRPFTLTLNIPVVSDDHGPALAADGGAPGKAYLAYHAALVKKDAKALKPTLSPGNLAMFGKAEKKNDLAGYVAYLSEDHPVKSVKVTKAWGGRDKASLLIEGESALGKVSGEVFLVNAGGAWGVDEELVELALGR